MSYEFLVTNKMITNSEIYESHEDYSPRRNMSLTMQQHCE